MGFLSLLFALVIEQMRPFTGISRLRTWGGGWIDWVLKSFDAGGSGQGMLCWCIAALVPAGCVILIHWALALWLGLFSAFVWNVAVLYATLGFRQFSHYFTEIRAALEMGDDETARRVLQSWTGPLPLAPTRAEIIRRLVVQSVLSAHRHVFGVFAWYSIGSLLGMGPAGAVVYRIGASIQARAVMRVDAGTRASSAVQEFAARLWWFLDWLPVRMTAMGFAFVGSFEESIDLWRRWEIIKPGDNDALLLAATSGAIGLQLNEPAGVVLVAPSQEPLDGKVEPGDALDGHNSPQIGHLAAVVGLVWRTVVMWLVLLALMTLARLLG
jgi:adenosylcobinamide-phosphate synthase